MRTALQHRLAIVTGGPGGAGPGPGPAGPRPGPRGPAGGETIEGEWTRADAEAAGDETAAGEAGAPPRRGDSGWTRP